ncbi:MAG: polysaccharide biosynthesis protein [Acetobacteraceae bacterium]|nr:polysaccharide biosynthesis protein [Acetobacteraceae bacterium]
MLDGKRVLITGGTGSLGQVLLRRLLSGRHGSPAKLIVLSRDEGKQHDIRVRYQNKLAGEDALYENFRRRLEFRIGDVRDYASVAAALRDVDMVFNAAALKQVPACEYFPYEAVRTNVEGPENIVRAIRDQRLPVETVVGVSTDKATKPVNVMGMTKALQERIFARANLELPGTRCVIVRYGNVLASRGSVIPLFHEQIRAGGPVTVTDPRMTRFLLSLEEAVDVIMAAVAGGRRGETYIPRVPTARVTDIARALIDGRDIPIRVTGIRPGEKLHETLISEEEAARAFRRGDYFVIQPILPELREGALEGPGLRGEYSSEHGVMSYDALRELLVQRDLMLPSDGRPVARAREPELLR